MAERSSCMYKNAEKKTSHHRSHDPELPRVSAQAWISLVLYFSMYLHLYLYFHFYFAAKKASHDPELPRVSAQAWKIPNLSANGAQLWLEKENCRKIDQHSG